MSDHAQALPLSTKVHAVFGYTLMLAGVTRLTEVCFVAPSYTPGDGVEDNRSDHTLADGTGAEAASASTKGRTFRHLPPFVSSQARSRFIILYPSPLPFSSLSLSLSFFKTECRRDEITVAFSGRGPIVYVRDRRRTAIRPRKRDGPCDIHPYYVQVRFFLFAFASARLPPSTLGRRPRHFASDLTQMRTIQHRILAIRAHRLPGHAIRHVRAQCTRRGADEGHFFR